MELVLVPSIQYYVDVQLQPSTCIWQTSFDSDLAKIDLSDYRPCCFHCLAKHHINSWTNFKIRPTAAIEAVKIPQSYEEINTFLKKILCAKFQLKQYTHCGLY